MAKYINDSQITGDKGVARFHSYCSNHEPFIIWRELSNHDFGIDGEVEFTNFRASGKKEVTGHILKIQLKSSERGSYFHQDNGETFVFQANRNDIEYWAKNKLGVVLVIYDVTRDELYAKLVPKVKAVRAKGNKVPITFSRIENKIDSDKNDFVKRFSTNAIERLNFVETECLASNIFKFSKLPYSIFHFKAKITNLREIFDSYESYELPIFKIHDGRIYLYYDPSAFRTFCKEIIDESDRKLENFDSFLRGSIDKYRIAIELLNLLMKEVWRGRDYRLRYNRHHNRYFFLYEKKGYLKSISGEEILDKDGNGLKNTKDDLDSRIEFYHTIRSKGSKESRTVVKYYEYGKHKFFRHHAFSMEYFLNEKGLWVAINPKYFFTTDGYKVLEDKSLVTKLTNYLTSKEFNRKVYNDVHFLFEFLKGKNRNTRNIIISEKEKAKVELSKYEIFDAPFGISLDQGKTGIIKQKKGQISNQIDLFKNEG